MKAVFMYDTVTRIFKGSKLVEDDYVVQSGETEIEPSEGLYDPKKLSEDGTTWIGTDQEVWQAEQDAANQEYLKEHPESAPQPTVEQQQIAELIKSNAQQMALNAQLVKQLATLQTSQATQTAQTAQAVQAAQTDTTQEAK